MRFLLLLLVVALIVALLAWLTGQRISAQVSPIPPGPGEAAWRQPTGLLAVAWAAPASVQRDLLLELDRVVFSGSVLQVQPGNFYRM